MNRKSKILSAGLVLVLILAAGVSVSPWIQDTARTFQTERLVNAKASPLTEDGSNFVSFHAALTPVLVQSVYYLSDSAYSYILRFVGQSTIQVINASERQYCQYKPELFIFHLSRYFSSTDKDSHPAC